MAIQRVFLGWDSPCLPSAAEWLTDRYCDGRGCDLSGVLAVVPGRRSGRRLLELLVEKNHGRVFVPPLIKTAGELPEQLYNSDPPAADPLGATLARVCALQQADRDLLQTVVPYPPADGDWLAWVRLADDLAQIDEQLAADAVPIDQAVSRCETGIDSFADQARWQALAALRQAYEAQLAQQGYQDRHTARHRAMQSEQCKCDYDVVLIATADLHLVTQRMLKQIDHRSVTSLIHAPPDEADSFDELGCLRVDQWADRPLDLDAQLVRVADQPRDQAQAVLRVLRETAAGQFTADQITVGLGDEATGSTVQRALELAGVPARLAADKPVTQTRPAMLLAAMGGYFKHADQPRLADFATLLRHPDFEAYLAQLESKASIAHQGIADWLSLVDRYATDHLQSRMAEPWLGEPERRARLKAVHDRVQKWISPLAGPPQPLPTWSGPIGQALSEVYGQIELTRHNSRHAQLIRALQAIGQALREQAKLDPQHPVTPRLTGAEAISLTLARLAGQQVPSEGGQPAVELLGWLELQLDDAPVLVITGMNEGLIPRSANADAFLPDHTRRVLGIEDNRHRYARDKMMLTAILRSRAHVVLIAGRRAADGNPLSPSRLLVAGDADQAVAMIERFYSDDAGAAQRRPQLAGAASARWSVPPPLPPREPINELSVTAFGDYLACPYRFYLKHVLKLAVRDDQAVEMDGRLFGTLAHEALGAFGRSDVAHSTDAKAIERYLFEQLDELAAERFGSHSPASVRIQCGLLRGRLTAFAHWQAGQAQEGWRIVREHVEKKLEHAMDIDGWPFTIKGRIDRIDRHPERGYRILDYKTGDSAKTPDQSHRIGPKKKKQWTNLQLPLYLKLAASVGIEGGVALGFVQLPKDAPRFDKADWSDADLQDAFEQATRVIRNIREGVFWPPADPPPRFAEDFAPICMDGCFERPTVLGQGGRS